MDKKYVAYVVMGGSGFAIDEINADEEWVKGAGEEYIGEAGTREEANQLIDDHLNGLI